MHSQRRRAALGTRSRGLPLAGPPGLAVARSTISSSTPALPAEPAPAPAAPRGAGGPAPASGGSGVGEAEPAPGPSGSAWMVGGGGESTGQAPAVEPFAAHATRASSPAGSGRVGSGVSTLD